jgi:hypothetical protein
VSRESVAVVRRAYAAWDRRDFVPAAFWADDLEWYASPEDPDTSATQGRVAVQQVLDDWLAHLGRYDLQCELIDAGEEVLACLGFTLEGAHVPLLSYHACRVANAKIDRVRAYASRDDALRAVGLER